MSTLKRVLLVEDDDVDVMNVRRAFKRNEVPFDLIHRGNGLEALDYLRGEGSDISGMLMLLDLNMPKMNGIELLKEVRADEKLRKIPVVVLTSSDDERDRVEAYDLNVAGYIVKPVTFDKFVDVVGNLKGYWEMVQLP